MFCDVNAVTKKILYKIKRGFYLVFSLWSSSQLKDIIMLSYIYTIHKEDVIQKNINVVSLSTKLKIQAVPE